MSHWGRSGARVARLQSRFNVDDTERSLYLRIKNWYHDLLRASNQDISDDSEASSNDTDDDEDAAAKYERRQQRDAKRDETKRRVKRLKGQGKIPKEYGNVDVVTDFMDSQGHILNVSPSPVDIGYLADQAGAQVDARPARAGETT